MIKLCNYIEADGLTCCMPVKIKKDKKTNHCKRHTCLCGQGKPSFLVSCRDCIYKNNDYLPAALPAPPPPPPFFLVKK